MPCHAMLECQSNPFHAMLCYTTLCYTIPPKKTYHHNHQTSNIKHPSNYYLYIYIHFDPSHPIPHHQLITNPHTNPTATAASAIENLIDEAEDSTFPQQSCVYVTLFARAATWNTEPAEGEPRL